MKLKMAVIAALMLSSSALVMAEEKHHWGYMTTPVNVSKAQVAAFTKAMGHANNRPVQPLNLRQVLLQ